MDGKNRIVKDILESVEKNMGTGENLSWKHWKHIRGIPVFI